MARVERRSRGVVHTPVELARYGVQRVDTLVREQLGISAGLEDPRIALLDPSVGTGVWLGAAFSLTRARPPAPVWAMGLDIDPRALEQARCVLEPEARARGWSLALREANTLGEKDVFADDDRVRVVVGNPPWAARSESRGTELSDRLLDDFRRDEHGARLTEKRLGVLSDDYVRFFRWTVEQARAAKSGAVICLATNASYLDGPVHRGMRRMLLDTFDHIEVLDLGGNSLLSREAEPDGNVFGVRVSVALTLAVRRANVSNRPSALSYARIAGSREEKLSALSRGEIGVVRTWTPEAPTYLFVPRALQARTPESFSIDEAFPFHREGIQTNRDGLCVAQDEATLRERLWAFVRGELSAEASRHFRPQHAREVLKQRLEEDPASVILKVSYRPFDERFVCVVPPLCHRPRPELIRACARSTLCLLSARKDRGRKPWSLVGASRRIADNCFLSNLSSCRTRVFPSHREDGSENVALVIKERLETLAEQPVGVEDLFAFISGALASPAYRRANDEALKHDYARVPWPRDRASFNAFVHAGRVWLNGFLLTREELALSPQVVQGDDDLLARAEVGHFRLSHVNVMQSPASNRREDELSARARLWVEAGALADAAHQTNGSV